MIAMLYGCWTSLFQAFFGNFNPEHLSHDLYSILPRERGVDIKESGGCNEKSKSGTL